MNIADAIAKAVALVEFVWDAANPGDSQVTDRKEHECPKINLKKRMKGVIL